MRRFSACCAWVLGSCLFALPACQPGQTAPPAANAESRQGGLSPGAGTRTGAGETGQAGDQGSNGSARRAETRGGNAEGTGPAGAAPAASRERGEGAPAARSGGAPGGQPGAGPDRAAAPSGRIRVGAWNIQWLGLPEERRGGGQGVEQKPEDLADYIADARVSVLALAEIANLGDASRPANPILDRTFELVGRKGGGRWEYRLFATRERNQNVGVAWDTTRVRLVGEPETWADPGTRSAAGTHYWNRPAVAATFSAGEGLTDFVVIPLHMKSNAKSKESDENLPAHRGEEARLLVEAMREKRGPERDIILIGDTNCLRSDEPALLAYAAAGWVDLNAGDLRTTAGGKGAPFDRALVPGDQPEFRSRTFEVPDRAFREPRRMTPAEYAKRFSDHYMAITEVAVMKDDD